MAPKVILFGVGMIGQSIVRILDDRGIEIVGAIDVNPNLSGLDLGEVAGLDRPLGVPIMADAIALLAETEANVAIMATTAELSELQSDYRACIDARVNVIGLGAGYTLGEATLSASLNELAVANEVTISSTGMHDAFGVNITACLAAACERIDAVNVTVECDLDHEGQGPLELFGIGQPADLVREFISSNPDILDACAINAEYPFFSLGLELKDLKGGFEVKTAETDFTSIGGVSVKAGEVCGVVLSGRATSAEGVVCEVSYNFVLYQKGEDPSCPIEWQIRGLPNLDVKLERADVHRLTCVQLVNRAHDVICARPGLLRTDELGRPLYRS